MVGKFQKAIADGAKFANRQLEVKKAELAPQIRQIEFAKQDATRSVSAGGTSSTFIGAAASQIGTAGNGTTKAINRLHKLIDQRIQKPPTGQKKKPVQPKVNQRDDKLVALENIRKMLSDILTAFNNVGGA